MRVPLHRGREEGALDYRQSLQMPHNNSVSAASALSFRPMLGGRSENGTVSRRAPVNEMQSYFDQRGMAEQTVDQVDGARMTCTCQEEWLARPTARRGEGGATLDI